MSTYDVMDAQQNALATEIIVHPCGQFLRVYDSAAVQVSIATGYQLKDICKTHKMCGFPDYRLVRVMQLMPEFVFKVI